MKHRTAGDLMSSPAVTAQPHWTVVQAAQVMDGHKVKRLPAPWLRTESPGVPICFAQDPGTG